MEIFFGIEDKIDAFVSSLPDSQRPVLEEWVAFFETPDAEPKVPDVCFKFPLDLKSCLSTRIRNLSDDTGLPIEAIQELIYERILH